VRRRIWKYDEVKGNEITAERGCCKTKLREI
jgi:hypothetical protein